MNAISLEVYSIFISAARDRRCLSQRLHPSRQPSTRHQGQGIYRTTRRAFMNKFGSRNFSFLSISLLVVVSGHAQVSTGTIAGSVNDSTGARTVGAKVTATNTSTGIATTSTTDAAGRYSLPNLQPGSYSGGGAAPGFSGQVVDGLDLKVGGQQELNFSLKVGAVTEKVVVTATLQGLDLVSSTNMPMVDERTIVELPLNGRDWTSLANLQPGVSAVRTQPAVAVTNQRANRGVGNQLTVGGARPQQNNYRVDGISINDYSNGGPGGVIGSNLGVDAIQEFSVVTGNATSDYGKTAGGIINAVTRTGGNKFHGDAYEFFRNSALDARNEFDPAKIPALRRNQFGASLGGPVIKDRTFLFGDYEGLRWFNSQSASSTVPSPDARVGNMCVGTTCASHTQVTVSPAVQPYIAFYPLPNLPALPAAYTTGTSDTGTYSFADPFRTSENYFTIHADHKLSATDQLAATYFWDSGKLTAPEAFNEKLTGNIDKRQMASVSESHTFTAALLNTFHFGYSRVVSDAT